MSIAIDGLGETWQVTNNTFKQYASCLLTHAAIDAARQISHQLNPMNIKSVQVEVHPLTIEVAGKTEVNGDLEGKFSLIYCVSLGLLGRAVGPDDFGSPARNDKRVRDMMSRIVVHPNANVEKTAALLAVSRTKGHELRVHVPLALGNPGNPMTWNALESKFLGLTERHLGGRSRELFKHLRSFDELSSIDPIRALIAT